MSAPKRFSVERVLISAGGVSRELERRGYFHRIVGLDAIFAP